MFYLRSLRCATALALVLSASPALADLNVDQAWGVWKAQIKAIGLTMEADESREGDALQIEQMTFAVQLPADLGAFSFSGPGPRFEPVGDGTVSVTYPEGGRASFKGNIEGEGSLSAAFDLQMNDAKAVMSGTPEKITSHWTGSGMEMSLIEASVDGEPLENVSGKMGFDAYALTNITTFSDDMIIINQDASYDGYELSYDYEFKADEDTISGNATGFAKDMKVIQTLELPAAGIDVMNLHTLLRSGLRLSNSAQTSSYGNQQSTSINGVLMSNQNTTAENYQIDMKLDETGVEWSGGSGAFTGDMQIAELPFAIKLEGTSATGRMLMPLLKSDTPQDAAFQLDLQGMTINDEVWALGDPTGELPRDPMSFVIDITGQLDVSGDLVDFAMLSELEDGSELVLPSALSLNSLLISAVGTELTGNGAFTFDAADTETFPGMPRPEGTVDLKLVGGNTLLDRLVAMGLIPEDQAMGTRMMMGMFTVAGDGDDVLNSTIEINAEGHVLANGQRLK